MSDQHHDFPKTSISQVLLAILGGLFAPMIAIILVVKLFMGISDNHLEDADPETVAATVEERIKPVADVDVAEVSGTKAAMSGDMVYEKYCLACHGSGALGAPMFGDKAAWAPRIAQGYETLIKHAIEGINQMPARGGNPDLTDTEIANAVAYMANEAGAKFTPPATDDEGQAEEAETAATEENVAADAEKADEGKTNVAVADATDSKAGEKTYQAVCAMCHAAGLMEAPKLGDKAAWEPRIAQGKATLVEHAIKGIRMMPAKGGNPGLSDDEVKQAVVYMANKSGASF